MEGEREGGGGWLGNSCIDVGLVNGSRAVTEGGVTCVTLFI